MTKEMIVHGLSENNLCVAPEDVDVEEETGFEETGLVEQTAGLRLSRVPQTAMIRVKKKEITIGKDKYKVDAYDLMRMIRQVTQTIGEYKEAEHTYSAYVIHGLRKVRNDMASDLETHFSIHFQIDPQTGKSIFFLG